MSSWNIKSGYLFRIYPTSEESKVFDEANESCPTTYFGFHGLDVSPIDQASSSSPDSCEYFADAEGEDGYIVLSQSDEAPLLADGWAAESVEPEEGPFTADESGYKTVCLEKPRHGREGVYAVSL